MTTFLLVFGLLLLVTLGMAIGVIARGRSIAGSCGGLNAIPGVDRCQTCQRKIDPGSEIGARSGCRRARRFSTESDAQDRNS